MTCYISHSISKVVLSHRNNIAIVFNLLSFFHAALDNVIDIESSNNTIGEDTSFNDGVDSPPSVKMECIKEGISENGMVVSEPVPSFEINKLYVEDCLPEHCACVNCQLWRPLSTDSISWLKFRGRVRIFVEKKYFDWFILFMVFFSSFMLVGHFMLCIF